jgi:hypothetical protein
MFTLLLGVPFAAYDRYVAHAGRIALCNEVSQQKGGSQLSTNLGLYIDLGVAGFLLLGVPNLIYFYRRRKWFGVVFNCYAENNQSGAIASAISSDLSPISPSDPTKSVVSVVSSVEDREFYAHAYREAQEGSAERDPGVWAIAFSNANGDSTRCQAEYIRLRAAFLNYERQQRLVADQQDQSTRATTALAGIPGTTGSMAALFFVLTLGLYSCMHFL